MELQGEQWEWVSFTSGMRPDGGTAAVTTYRNYVAPEDVPALGALRAQLATAGYTFAEASVAVYAIRAGPDQLPRYEVSHRAAFRQDDGLLIVGVRSPEQETVEEALVTATTRISELRYAGVVPGGRGQTRQCGEIAARIYAAHGQYLPPNGQVIVAYATRGGRYGRLAKTGHRYFEPAELRDGPPATGRYRCAQCGQLTPARQRKWDRAAQQYVSACCGAPLTRRKVA